ncbi:MAG: TraR/DksA C4-type zinc finger protein [Acidimicrobiia bacterium]
MADTSTAAVRARLQTERDQVQAELTRLTEGDFDEGFADSGQVTAERGQVEALTGKLAESLAEIDDALAKLDAGSYGACESCGKPISEARLEAVPSARTCIDCASQRR